jgi:glycerophosphoryl diester phosphodiesterase
VEHTDLRELDRLDFGGWRGDRFRDIRIAHLGDALRLARRFNVSLYLDVKTKGIGPELLAALAREGMSERVIFGGEWDDIHLLDPRANKERTAYLEPGMTREQVDQLREAGQIVIGNFLANGHETELPAMRAAVAAGVDAIMVDYPRLGAEAVGRPVETRLEQLVKQAGHGVVSERISAIRELSEYTGFPLARHFVRWLSDPDQTVSHEAALALVTGRPVVKLSALRPLLLSSEANARRNAAWAIGQVSAQESDSAQCIPSLLPLLDDIDPSVVKEALLALTWCPTMSGARVSADRLLALMSSPTPIIRGLAAVALARYQPQAAVQAIPRQLAKEEAEAAEYDAAWAKRGRAKLAQSEIDKIIELYRAQMKYIQALSMLPAEKALLPLAQQAFRPVHDYSSVTALVAGYQLWDRLSIDPDIAIKALTSPDREVADRAEWALIEAGSPVLPAVRASLTTASGNQRRGLIRIVAWQADEDALPVLQQLEATDDADLELIQWLLPRPSFLRIAKSDAPLASPIESARRQYP